MQVAKSTVTVHVLTLTDEEAQWLNAQMQNPLHQQHPDDETNEDKEMRKAFFNATRT